MVVQGNLKKMSAVLLVDHRVKYHLDMGGHDIAMNRLVGQPVAIKYRGVIHCASCGKVTKKSYAQGFCYNCMQTVPEAEDCVLRPVLCKAHLGIARDLEWAQGHCLQPHFVYLANTGEVKVGVTRASQIPTRWIDQGASEAIRLFKTPNRHIAGLIEAFLTREFPDKTQWKKMVTNDVNRAVDLLALRKKVEAMIPDELAGYLVDNLEIQKIEYPVTTYPTQPKAINLDHEPEVRGFCMGIKGQYLLFDDNRVLNVRTHTGYFVELELVQVDGFTKHP
jgi:hypothetical protein